MTRKKKPEVVKGFFVIQSIWDIEELDVVESLILADIVDMASRKKTYFKSNSAIAKHCKCSISKVTKAIARLIELGYISMSNFDGRKRTLMPNNTLVCGTRVGSTGSSPCEGDYSENTGSLVCGTRVGSTENYIDNKLDNNLDNNLDISILTNTIKGENKISAQAQDNPDPDIVEAEVLDESEAVQDSFELVPQQAPATVKQATAYSAEFETFWKAYPIRKVKKRLAYQQWCKTIKHVTVNTIMQGLERVKQGDITYMPEPMRWLRDERWEDEADFSELLKNPAVKRERENQFMSNYIRENAQQLAQYNPWE